MLLTYDCYPGCPGGRRGTPGLIGSGTSCVCGCHRRLEDSLLGDVTYPCGNRRQGEFAGVDPEVVDLLKWLGYATPR